ncbi:MAG: tetratricopeptide repeat protein, partial [Flavobacteriaceae bacterium]
MKRNKRMKSVLILCSIIFMCHASFSQELDKEQAKALTESKNLTWEANESLSENNFVEAEADYRRAISKSNENSAAPYNLGNAYYNTENYSEAFGRYKQAGELAMEKADKHHAYHNMGNVFMKRKEYEKAVEAYKEALRNNPTDEETRYNYALAKEMLKKQQNEQQNDQNEDDKEQNEEKNKGDN